MRELAARQTCVLASHDEQQGAVRAALVWEVGAADEYLIPVSDGLQVSFDGHFPVLPSGVILRDSAAEADHSAIAGLFGQDMNEIIEAARQNGIVTARLALSAFNRQALAQLQIESTLTSERLRDATALCSPTATRGHFGLTMGAVTAAKFGNI